MAFDVERVLRLWTELPSDDEAAEAAFRELYADPVVINGAAVDAAGLVARARAIGAAFDRLERSVLQVVDGGPQVAVAFRLRGRHVGRLDTAAGPLPATGQELDIRIIDVLTINGGRISTVWMVADELAALAAAGAVRLSGDSVRPSG